MVRAILISSAVSALSLVLAGCGAKEQRITAPTGQDVIITEESADSRTVETEDGLMKATGTKGAENARFPAHAPAYPGATVQTSVDMDIGPMKQHIITMMTKDSEEAVLKFYEAEAAKAGLPTKRMNSPTGGALTIGEPGLDGLTDTMVTTVTTDLGTSVNVSVTEK